MEDKALTLPEKDLKVLTAFEVRGNQLKEEATKLVVANASDVLTANSLFKQTQLAEKDIEARRKEMVAPFNDFVKQINGLAKEVGNTTAEAKLIVSQKLLAYNEEQERIRREKAELEKKELEERRQKEENDRLEREAAEQKKRDEENARLKKIADEQAETQRKINTEQDLLKKKQAEIDAKNLEEQRKLEEQRIANEQVARQIKLDQEEVERQKKQMIEDEEKKKKAEAQAVIDAANKPKGLREGYKFDIVEEDKVPREYCSPDPVKIRAAIKKGVLTIQGLNIFEDKRIQ